MPPMIQWPLLKGLTAAITGGTTGIGRAITLEYIRQGCNVAVNHLGLERDEPHRVSLLEEAQKIRTDSSNGQSDGHATAGEIFDVVGDVTNAESCRDLVDQTVARWGKLDVFVANAGIFRPAEFLEIEPDLFDRTVAVNLGGSFYSCQAAARQMVKQGNGGSIIGVSSVSALVGGGLQTHYTPTKAGVLSLMQSMAISLGKHKIRCNALMPGTIKTQLSADDMKNDVKRNYLEARIPLGRVGDPEEMAGPAVFLACNGMSSYVNGSGLLADGGMFVHLQ